MVNSWLYTICASEESFLSCSTAFYGCEEMKAYGKTEGQGGEGNRNINKLKGFIHS